MNAAQRPGIQFRAKSTWLFAFCLLSIVLFGLWLRIRDLDRSSFWLDEIFGVETARRPLGEIFSAVPKNKPPLDYYPLHFALRAGENEFFARLPACLYGALSVGAVALLALTALARGARREEHALFAALLLAVNAFHLRYSQEARPYMLMFLLTALSQAGFCRLLLDPRGGSRGWWLACLLCSLAALLTMYLSAIPLLLTLLFLLLRAVWHSRRSPAPARRAAWRLLFNWCVLCLLLLLLLAPLLPRVAAAVNENFGYEFPEFGWRDYWRQLVILGVGYDTRQYMRLLVYWPVSALILPLAGIGAIALYRRDREVAVWLIMQTLGNWLAVLGFYAWLDRWIAFRYLILTFAFFPLLLAAGLLACGRFCARLLDLGTDSFWGNRLARLPAFALFLLTFFWIDTHPSLRTEWRELADYFIRHRTAQTAAVGLRSWDAYCVKYYLKRRGVELPVYEVDDQLQPVLELRRRHPQLYLFTGKYVENAELLDYLNRLPAPPREFYPILLRHTFTFAAQMQFADFRRLAIQFFAEGGEYPLAENPLNILGRGWGAVEQDPLGALRWIEGKECEIFFWQERPAAYRLTLEGEPAMRTENAATSAVAVELSINGRPDGYFTLEPGWHNYEIAIEAELLRTGVNQVDLRFERTVPRTIDTPRGRRAIEAAACFARLRFDKIDETRF